MRRTRLSASQPSGDASGSGIRNDFMPASQAQLDAIAEDTALALEGVKIMPFLFISSVRGRFLLVGCTVGYCYN